MRRLLLCVVAVVVAVGGGCRSSSDESSPRATTTSTTELPRDLPSLVPAARAVFERASDRIEDRDAVLRACILLGRAAAEAEAGRGREGLIDGSVQRLRKAADTCRTDAKAAAAELAAVEADQRS
jgi:hypothetical protein